MACAVNSKVLIYVQIETAQRPVNLLLLVPQVKQQGDTARSPVAAGVLENL